MIIKIQKIIVETYGDMLRERTRKLLRDIMLLLCVFFAMLLVSELTKGSTITLLNVPYRVDILLFYMLWFILILSTSILFKDFRNFLNIASTFIITRFPRMNGDFTPGKMILRDLVQIFLLFLIFYPLSESLKNFSFFGAEIIYFVSMAFLLMCLIFVYHMLTNFSKMIDLHFEKVITHLEKKDHLH